MKQVSSATMYNPGHLRHFDRKASCRILFRVRFGVRFRVSFVVRVRFRVSFVVRVRFKVLIHILHSKWRSVSGIVHTNLFP